MTAFATFSRLVSCSALLLALTSGVQHANAQLTAPCDPSYSYGSGSDQMNQDTDVESGMNPNTAEMQQIILSETDRANSTEGNALGCPVALYSNVLIKPMNIMVPTLQDLVTYWNANHTPLINNYVAYANVCPDIGRTGGAYGLAGYYTLLASKGPNMTGLGLETISLGQLAKIELMFYRSQYSNVTMGGTTQPAGAGSFGYINAGTSTGTSYPSMCSLVNYTAGSTSLAANVSTYCSDQPSACVVYADGVYADPKLPLSFQVADYGTVGRTIVPDGSIGYDEGWAGVSLMEASLQQPSGVDQVDFQSALTLAGSWASAEPPVRDENYTAKLIWLLAELYDQTGSPAYQAALQNKLYNDVLLDILMDQNNDGYVDGLSNVKFTSLTAVAVTPGRMWDGHNSLPEYAAMNAWALVEATVAFFDQGDTIDGAKVEPYAIAMLNNIASEINNIGVPSIGSSQTPTALLLGLWKLASVDAKQAHPLVNGTETTNWETAVQRLYTQGAFKAPSVAAQGSYQQPDVAAPNMALYMLYLSGAPYVPLNQR